MLWTWFYVNLNITPMSPMDAFACKQQKNATVIHYISSIDYMAQTENLATHAHKARIKIRHIYFVHRRAVLASVTHCTPNEQKKMTRNMNGANMWSSQIIYHLMAEQCFAAHLVARYVFWSIFFVDNSYFRLEPFCFYLSLSALFQSYSFCCYFRYSHLCVSLPFHLGDSNFFFLAWTMHMLQIYIANKQIVYAKYRNSRWPLIFFWCASRQWFAHSSP